MATLEWDKTGEHWFEIGVDHGVLYPVKNGKYQKGVAWNGLTAVTEQPEGAEPNDQYADNIKYITLRSMETFGATIEAFTYPDEFRACDGSAVPIKGVSFGQQPREKFGFCYRTNKGNDAQGQDAGYILHLLYGCTVSPSEKAYATINDSPEAITFSWELDTDPVKVDGYKPTACVTIDSTEVPPEQLARLERVLYGSLKDDPRLPMPDEIVGIMTTPVQMFAVSVPKGNTQIGNRKADDFMTGVSIADDGTVSGTVKKVLGWSGPGPKQANITNYVLPIKLDQESGAHVTYKVTSKDGGILATIASHDGYIYPIIVKNHDGMKMTVTQSDTNDPKNDPTIVKVYDFTNVQIDDTTNPVDAVTFSSTSTYIKSYMDEKHTDKKVEDLQEDLVIRLTGANTAQAEGTLHNVEGFTSFYDKERPNGHFMIFRMAPKDTTHRIGVKSSEAKGGTDSVFDANDFIVLARVDEFLQQKDKALTLYEYDSDGANKLNTIQLRLDTLTLG